MKKIICVCLLVLFVQTLPFGEIRGVAYANINESTEEEILTEIETQIDALDFSSIEDYYEDNIAFDSFRGMSIKEVVSGLINGELNVGIEEIINLILSSIKVDLPSVLKLVSLIVVISGFGAFSEMLRSSKKTSDGVGAVVSLIILTAILSIVATILADFTSETILLLDNMQDIAIGIFPILLSLVITLGSGGLGATMQPIIVFLTSGVTTIISSLTKFTVIIYFVLTCLGELTESVKLDKLKSVVSSIFKWGVGLVFTVFMGYMSLNGIISAGRDGLSVKTAKYALKNYIPMIGGYISDSYEIFRVGGVLIKNSVGVVGVALLFGMAIKKVLTLGVYKLGFSLASGLTEPLNTSKITRFLSSLSTLFNFLIVGIITSFLMIILTIFILMSLVNI